MNISVTIAKKVKYMGEHIYCTHNISVYGNNPRKIAVLEYIVGGWDGVVEEAIKCGFERNREVTKNRLNEIFFYGEEKPKNSKYLGDWERANGIDMWKALIVDYGRWGSNC